MLRMPRLLGLLLAFSLVTLPPSPSAATAHGSAAARASESAIDHSIIPALSPTIAQEVGQRLMVGMSGTTPTAALLGRIRRGEVGGVILFGSNVRMAIQVRALTRKLQAAATAGGQPRLLISTDQEGGLVRRLAWAAPVPGAPAMGRDGRTSYARSQGALAGRDLLAVGINVDLAPVADVPASTASFMYAQGRTWSFSSAVTTRLANAFADGLVSKGVAATMKHFPGLGYARLNTDLHSIQITATRAQLAAGEAPYVTAIAHGIPMIMLSNAVYTALDGSRAAGWSHTIGVTLLRHHLGFAGVTITDGLDGAARSRGLKLATLAVRAMQAGTDMILVTGTESTSAGAYQAMLAAVKAGHVSSADLFASWQRIQALKSKFPGS